MSLTYTVLLLRANDMVIRSQRHSVQLWHRTQDQFRCGCWMFYSLSRTASNSRAQLFEGKCNVDSEMQLLDVAAAVAKGIPGAGNVRYHTKP